MTQLFDTTDYDLPSDDEAPAHQRHLRGVPSQPDPTPRAVTWRLDEATIEAGRRGIALARQALRDAARRAGDDQPSPTRRAA